MRYSASTSWCGVEVWLKQFFAWQVELVKTKHRLEIKEIQNFILQRAFASWQARDYGLWHSAVFCWIKDMTGMWHLGRYGQRGGKRPGRPFHCSWCAKLAESHRQFKIDYFGLFQTEARRAIGSILLVPRYAGWDTIIPSLSISASGPVLLYLSNSILWLCTGHSLTIWP